MEARHEDAIQRIYQADKSLAEDGREPEHFHLRHSGGMQSHIEHPRWDSSWATPSEHTIDDLEEMGYLRVEPHHNKTRSFALTLRGRGKGEELALPRAPGNASTGQGRLRGDSYNDEERRRYRLQAQAQENLAIQSFLGQVGDSTFTADGLVAAVQMPNFDVTAAVRWLRAAHAEGKVSPVGGGWQVNAKLGRGPTFHVRVVPIKARDLLSGPIYALDLTEAEVLERFVGSYQERTPISWGDRTLESYRKPKIGRLYESGAKTVAKISENLRESRMAHSAREAEELFFKKTVQDVTDDYISSGEPAQVDAGSAPDRRSRPPGDAGKAIFVVHGHARKDEVARFLEQVIKQRVVVLEEQPGRSRTIIEKFEDLASGAAFAVVLLTADDVVAAKDQQDQLHARARQNAVLELGYFIGRIGRENVVVLYEHGVELPSDYDGIEYISFAADWKLKLMGELRAADFEVVPPPGP